MKNKRFSLNGTFLYGIGSIFLLIRISDSVDCQYHHVAEALVNKENTLLTIYSREVNRTVSLSALGSSHFMPHSDKQICLLVIIPFIRNHIYIEKFYCLWTIQVLLFT